jgi:Tol biopolymer transport system component
VHECYRKGPVDTSGFIDRLFEPNGDLTFYKPEAADLCISEVGSGVESRVVTGVGGDWRPSWSPDGTRIAYLRQDGIYLTTPTGKKSERVSEIRPPFSFLEQELVWSPTGDRLLFSARPDYGDFDVYSLEIESGALRNLTSSRRTDDFSPEWTLGGTQVFYLSVDDISSWYDSELPPALEIRTLNADDTGDRVIYKPEHYYYPHRDITVANSGNIWYAHQSLFRIGIADGTLTKVLSPITEDILVPLIAPNEQYLLYYYEQANKIQMLNIQTGEVSKLTDKSSLHEDVALQPWTWAPDSEKFAAVAIKDVDFWEHNVRNLYIFNFQDRTLQPLVTQNEY